MTVQLLDTWESLLGRSWRNDASTDPYCESAISPSLRRSRDDERAAMLTHEVETALNEFGVRVSAGALLRDTADEPRRPWDPETARDIIGRVLNKEAQIDWERSTGGRDR